MTLLTLQPDNTVGLDVELRSSSPTNNYGTATTFAAGVDNSIPQTSKALIKFSEISSLPPGAIINSAILSLRCVLQASANDYNFAIHRSLVVWFEGSQSGSPPTAGQDGSTWNLRNANGSAAWSGGAGGTAGSDYATTATDTTLVTGTGVFFDWDVTADVQDFVDGTFTNNGWWLIGAAGTDTRKSFNSSGDSDVGERPILVIDYSDPSTDMAGSAAGIATVTAIIEADGRLTGAIAGTSSTSALLVSNAIFGSTAGTSTVTGILQATATIAGTTAGTSTAVANLSGPAEIAGSASGVATTTATGQFEGQLRGQSFGVSSATATGWRAARHIVRAAGCFEDPLLYITDGSVRENGQLNRLDLINSKGGWLLNTWRPVIAQYKNGGEFNDSPNYAGRRLTKRLFGNVIEVFELKLRSHDQNLLIQYTQEYFSWQESAADYWTSDWATLPVYLVAKAARELNPRYAIVHVMSIPELENPYSQPFYTNSGRAVFEQITLRLERGDWMDTPPGQSTCVPLSSMRSWTVAAWQTGS